MPTGCTQCTRQRLQCPGYPDLSQLRFRHETGRITAKQTGEPIREAHQRHLSKASILHLDRKQFKGDDGTGHQIEIGNPAAWPFLISVSPQAIEDCALAYFMSSYITSSMFEVYLPELCIRNTTAKNPLSSALRAAAFATFSIRIRNDKFTEYARGQYMTALMQTNESIADSKTAVLDTTLAAVLLLGLFEAVVFQAHKSLENWTAHTLGTMQLLQMRGVKQFDHNTSSQIYWHASYNIRTSCIQRRVSVPRELIKLGEVLQPVAITHSITAFSKIVDATASLRARIVDKSAPDLIYEALQLDQEVLALFDQSTDYFAAWAHPTYDKTRSVHYDDVSNRYPLRKVSKYRNSLLMIRIFLNELIWERMSGLDNEMGEFMGLGIEYSDHVKTFAEHNIADIADQVLESVQYFRETSDDGASRFCQSARILFWPLAILLNSVLCPPSAVDAILRQLDRLGSDLNFPQAVYAAKREGEQRSEADW